MTAIAAAAPPLSVIFDLDGTLVESAAAIRLALNQALAAQHLPELPVATVRGFIGHGVPHLMNCVADHLEIPRSSSKLSQLFHAFSAQYEVQREGNTLFEGARSALQALRLQGVALGLCTNKPMQPAKTVLQYLNIEEFFDYIIAGDSLSVRKPDPQMLLVARAALSAEHCLYVGDSEVDAETAHAAGVPFLLFTRGYRKSTIDSLAPWASFDDFAQFPDYVAKFLREIPEA
ncbi:phosphoglycolate phosphatase [Thioclava sp. GXIMD4215]|uniref:phosphoglycolate phosphatase n=1 Tax=Thioclava sp. GXIMD4215 TaxID=3131928 RepID=UPI00324E767C